MAKTILKCPLCAPNDPPTVEVVTDGTYHIVRCTACDLIRLANPPALDAIESIVGEEDYGYHGEIDWKKSYRLEELAHTNAYRNQYADHLRLVHMLKRVGLDVHAPLRVHDIGCSVGFELFFGKQRGWHVSGNDLAPIRRDFARANLGVDFELAYFADYEPQDLPLDVVILRHVLEHLPDPVAELKLIWKRLSPLGVVVIVLPNFNAPELRLKVLRQCWGLRRGGLEFMAIPEHHWQFTARTLERLLVRCGFAVRARMTSSTFTNHSTPVRFLKEQTINRLLLGTHLVIAAQKARN